MRKLEEHGKVIYILDKNEKHVICTEREIVIDANLIEFASVVSCIAYSAVKNGEQSGIRRTMKMVLKEAVEIGMNINDSESRREDDKKIKEDIKNILDDFFGGEM